MAALPRSCHGLPVAASYTILLDVTGSASTLAAPQFVARSDTEDRGSLQTLEVADDGITFVKEGLSW